MCHSDQNNVVRAVVLASCNMPTVSFYLIMYSRVIRSAQSELLWSKTVVRHTTEFYKKLSTSRVKISVGWVCVRNDGNHRKMYMYEWRWFVGRMMATRDVLQDWQPNRIDVHSLIQIEGSNADGFLP